MAGGGKGAGAAIGTFNRSQFRFPRLCLPIRLEWPKDRNWKTGQGDVGKCFLCKQKDLSSGSSPMKSWGDGSGLAQ